MTPYPSVMVPDLAWPGDGAWFVGTDTDIQGYGYVGASEACIEELAQHPQLDVMPVSLNDRPYPPPKD